ncbi:hypothetical protein [Kaarinaea lacus]
MNKVILESLAVVSTVILVGCASETKVEDNTPQNPTAVIKAEYVINGYLLPDARGKQTVYTRSDRRRIDQNIDYDSWVSSTFFGGGEMTDIARLDKNLIWLVNVEDKNYVECPIKGCAPNILSMLGAPETGDEPAPQDPNANPVACTTEMTKHEFTVESTGDTRDLNGFRVEKYDVNWRVEFSDKEKRMDKNSLHMELWTTAPTDTMQQAWKLHADFQEGYLEATGMNDNPLGKFVGQQVYMALAAFTGDTSKEGKDYKTAAGKEMAKIKGYPVSIKMELFSDSKACPKPKEEEKKAEFDINDPMKSAQDMLGGFFSKKAKEYVEPKAGDPIFRYIYEVKAVELSKERDSTFNVPAGFKMMDRS